MKTALLGQGLEGRRSVNVSANVSSRSLLQEALWKPADGEASSPAQVTPTSSLWAQLCFPQGAARQSARAASVPVHLTSSSQMGPAPQPKRPAVGSDCRGPPQPSSRQTTAVSRRSQPSSHTVPQRPACHTSSRPEHLLGPATRRSWGDPGGGRHREFEAGPPPSSLCAFTQEETPAGPDALCSPPLCPLSGEGRPGGCGRGRAGNLCSAPHLGFRGGQGAHRHPAQAPEGKSGGRAELRHRASAGPGSPWGAGTWMGPPWALSCCCLPRGPWEGHTREAYLGNGRGEVTTSPCCVAGGSPTTSPGPLWWGFTGEHEWGGGPPRWKEWGHRG